MTEQSEQQKQYITNDKKWIDSRFARWARKTVYSLLGFYLVIALVLPKTPTGDFYQSLNIFFDEHLGGAFLGMNSEPFSDTFYFSGKVMIILSHYLTLLVVLLFVLIIRFLLSSHEWCQVKYRFKKSGEEDRFLMLSLLLMIIVCYVNIDTLYVYEEEALTVARMYHNFFYGHYYHYLCLFIFCQMMAFGCLAAITLRFFIFCESVITKGN